MSHPISHGRKRVLLDRLPNLLSPRLLLLILLYSMAFTLLILGFKMIRLEHRIEVADQQLTDTQNIPYAEDVPLYQQESREELQKGIADNIIRLHVIANSDSQRDQALKLEVRDNIISQLQTALKNVSNMADARSRILSESASIQQTASRIISREGYQYTVKVSLGQRYFPVKVYGDLTFPAGEYEALCVEIGEAGGRNWWCVLFPSLCFLDETCAVVPEESKEKLKTSLTQEEYASLTQSNTEENAPTPSREPEVKLHLAFWDLLTGNQ